MAALADDTVADFVAAQGVERDVAAWAARLARGSIGRALGFLPVGGKPGPLENLRRDAFRIVSTATSSDAHGGYAVAHGFPPAGARGLLDLFSFVEEWVRDLAAVAAGAGERVLNGDARDRLEKVSAAARIDAGDVPAAFAGIERARNLARANVNPQLVVNGLVHDLREALLARTGRPEAVVG